MAWKPKFENGIKVQYWSGRTAFDPTAPESAYHRPIAGLPIVDDDLILDPNAGETPRTGGGGCGRFYGKGTWGETVTATVHSLSNLAWGQGGWRRITCGAPPDKMVALKRVVWSNRTRDDPSKVMGLAIDGAGELPAWKYANRHNIKTTNNGQDYEWCHLLGRGLGGMETSENLVAGTHACNSEQLCIESWLRDKAARGIYFYVKIRAQMSKEASHLAEGIGYSVYMDTNDQLMHYKWIDARRQVEPTREEQRAVWATLDASRKKLT